MRNAAGAEIPVKSAETIALDAPEVTCRAAPLGVGVTLIALCHALPHLERGALVRLVPQWYSDAGPIAIYCANRTLLPAKTRAFVDFVAEAFKRDRLAKRFAGSLGQASATLSPLQSNCASFEPGETCPMDHPSKCGAPPANAIMV